MNVIIVCQLNNRSHNRISNGYVITVYVITVYVIIVWNVITVVRKNRAQRNNREHSNNRVLHPGTETWVPDPGKPTCKGQGARFLLATCNPHFMVLRQPTPPACTAMLIHPPRAPRQRTRNQRNNRVNVITVRYVITVAR